MMVLVLGAGGQIGKSLMKRVPPGVKAVGLTHAALDLTDESALWSALESYSPEAVINAAAYTAVDRAETESAAAFAVNARAPELIAHWCRMRAVPFIHFGTDYVFDGTKNGAYTEADPVSPVNVYGRSKAEGEAAVIREGGAVLRVGWVHASTVRGFVPWVVKGLLAGGDLRVAGDQKGVPTAARTAAEIAWQVLSAVGQNRAAGGLYHVASSGVTTRFEAACFIRDCLTQEGLAVRGKLTEVKTKDIAFAAVRPLNCVLATDRLHRVFGIEAGPWQTGLSQTVRRILSEISVR